MRKPLLLLPLALTLGACATTPAPIAGDFAGITPAESVASGRTGERVRWGGQIIRVEPRADSTCFEVLGRELDDQSRPRQSDRSAGRFVACRAGFHDPEVFVRGRELTVVGTVTGSERGKVGEYEYTYAHVDADAIYLWPKRPLVVEQRYRGVDPFWGPSWGRWGSYWGGWWGPPPVVIVKPQPQPQPQPRP